MLIRFHVVRLGPSLGGRKTVWASAVLAQDSYKREPFKGSLESALASSGVIRHNDETSEGTAATVGEGEATEQRE